jgi:hypothetical protein
MADRRHKWTFERVALALTLVTSVIAFVFGLGVNWSRITQQEARIEAFERAYLRADVYAANQQRLTDSIDRLTVELQALREQPTIVDASVIPRERTTPRQKFDR